MVEIGVSLGRPGFGCYLAGVTDKVWEFPLPLARHGFTQRDVVRAGEIWRACQDGATIASSMAGWPPSRFVEMGTSFVVYKMSVVHGRETHYGEPVRAQSWVSSLRRRTLSTRHVRLSVGDELIAHAIQEWVHMTAEGRPGQGPEDMEQAYPVSEGVPAPAWPAYEDSAGPEHTFRFTMWHTWTDPLGHANHPAYVDWCDEALARALVEQNIDPLQIVPVAERVTFKRSVEAGEEVLVRFKRVGEAPNARVYRYSIEVGGELAATAETVRRLVTGELLPV